MPESLLPPVRQETTTASLVLDLAVVEWLDKIADGRNLSRSALANAILRGVMEREKK